MVAILDCGTTNTKCYIVRADGTFLNEKYHSFGVKDNVLKSDRQFYKQMLRSIIKETLEEIDKGLKDLNVVIAFGMISSDLGITILPHMVTPAGLPELRQGVFRVRDESIFGKDVKFYLIRGVKNKLEQERIITNVEVCDFMRGEETQVMGIIEQYHPQGAFNVGIFSSHFKIIHVSDEGKIIQSMTTMSGQIFDSLLNHTVVGKSVDVKNDTAVNMPLSEIIALAEDTVRSRGVNRALLCPRFMELFTDMTAMERLLYLDAVIGLEDLKAMREYYGDGIYQSKKYYFLGQKTRCQLFGEILKRAYPSAEVVILSNKDSNRQISVAGALQIINLSGNE